MSTPYVVETSGLTKRFAERVAVDNVGLRVPAELRLRLSGAERRRQDGADQAAARADPRHPGTMRLSGRPVPAERTAALAQVAARR
jgi:hypothetical protein